MDIDEYNRQIVDSAVEFLEIAGEFIHGFKLNLSPKTVLRRFISHFGVTPRLCAILWIYCKDRMEEVGQKKKHFLWVLNLLKTDSTEHALHGRWKADEKTIRKWIDWEYRKDNAQTNCKVFVSIDGTDFRIQEPSPFPSSWYSHKFKGPGVRYEVGVCIATRWIVWFYGPFRCGSWSDEKIVQYGLNQILDWGELYIADGGYKSKGMVLNPDNAVTQEINDYMQICRTRHETINTLFKHFAIIGNRFHRDVSKHGLFTHADLACAWVKV